MGNVCQSERRYEEALKHYHNSLDILTQICSSTDNHHQHHPMIASIYNNCGVALSQQKQYHESNEAYHKAIDTYKLHLGDFLWYLINFYNSPSLLSTMLLTSLPYIIDDIQSSIS